MHKGWETADAHLDRKHSARKRSKRKNGGLTAAIFHVGRFLPKKSPTRRIFTAVILTRSGRIRSCIRSPLPTQVMMCRMPACAKASVSLSSWQAQPHRIDA